MLAHFYIPMPSNNKKIALQKNHLGGQILYRSVHPATKTLFYFLIIIFLIFDSYEEASYEEERK